MGSLSDEQVAEDHPKLLAKVTVKVNLKDLALKKLSSSITILLYYSYTCILIIHSYVVP